MIVILSKITAILGVVGGVFIGGCIILSGKNGDGEYILDRKIAWVSYMYIILSLYWFCIQVKCMYYR